MSDWIEWSGGECPVPPYTRVEVRFRNGALNSVSSAKDWTWKWPAGRGAYDIVGYRVISEEPYMVGDPPVHAIKPDPVNSPPHYTDGGIEAIDYIEAKLGPDGFRSYCVGNALKYISRAGKKGSAKEDLSKAIWYLRRAGGE